MKRALVISLLVGLVFGTAGWFLITSQPAAKPKKTETANNPAQTSNSAEHGFFDIDFSQKMVVHHQQALEMVDTILATSNNAEVRNIATTIKQSQADAEAQYKEWLNEWGEQYTDLSKFPQMDGHDMYPSYPGLVSASSMNELKSANGAEADKLFVNLMVEHHKGGIQLSEMSSKLQYSKLISYQNSVFKNYKQDLKELETL